MIKIISGVFNIFLCLLFLKSNGQQVKKPITHIGEPVEAMHMQAGELVYKKYCISCHQADGLGVQRMNPPLSKTTWILGDKSRIIKVVLNGLSATDIDDETYNNVMASFDNLTDDQIANVLTYIRGSFGNKASAVKPSEVSKLRIKKK